MAFHYVKEMTERGYGPDAVDDFHTLCLPYIGEKYFPDKTAPVLDLGIGSGHCALPLLRAGWKNMHGFDIDGYHAEHFRSVGIEFKTGDIQNEKLPYPDNFFAGIVSFHLVEHLQNGDNYIREVARVLRPGGVFAMVTPNWRKQYKIFYRDHTHVHPYDKESIGRLVMTVGLVPIVRDFGTLRGLGRTGIWKKFPELMFTGQEMICFAEKPKNKE